METKMKNSRTQEQELQDKLWNDLDKKTQERFARDYRNAYNAAEYHNSKEHIGFYMTLSKIFGKHNLCPFDTYKELMDSVFKEDYTNVYRVSSAQSTGKNACSLISKETDYCMSENQARRLFAINRMMNVAEVLNEGWEADFKNQHQVKYYPYIDNETGEIKADYCLVNRSMVYFRTPELIQKTVCILGEDMVRLALGVYEKI